MKNYEDFFSELLTDMVGIALEYCKNSVDKVFIHCSNEKNCISSNVFFQKDGKKIRRSEFNGICDTEQKYLIHSINEKVKKLEDLCKKNNQKVPTEIRIVYEQKNKHLSTDFSYENLYSDSDEKIVQDVFQNWFDSI